MICVCLYIVQGAGFRVGVLKSSLLEDHAQGGCRQMPLGKGTSTRGLQGRAVSQCLGSERYASENEIEEGSRGWG